MIGIIQQVAIETSTWVLMSNANERVQCTVKGLRDPKIWRSLSRTEWIL